MPNSQVTLYTIGHSNQPAETFVALLAAHGAEVLADVRTAPYSRRAPHFIQAPLREALRVVKHRQHYGTLLPYLPLRYGRWRCAVR